MEPSSLGDAAGRYVRRARFELWRSLEPSYPVSSRGRALKVPGAAPITRTWPAHWRGNWKTALMGRLLDGRGGAFLDVGANQGQTLVDHFALDTRTRYLGFEPNPACAAMLNTIIAANALSHYTIAPIGLSNENTLLKLYVRGDKTFDASASLIEDLRPGRRLDAHYAPCYRLDDIAGVLGLNEIPLIKIDVEGAETFALEGMRATLAHARPWVICEVLYRDTDADLSAYKARLARLSALLDALNYAVYRIVKPMDESTLDGLEPIEAFPDTVWTRTNQHECDYVFAPAERAGELA